MRAAEIGVAASLGRDSVLTIRRPSVAIISTGDELISPGSPPEPGKIYNSNAFSIAAMVERYGGIPRIMGIAKDTIEALSEVLDGSIDSDMVVTSAGVSKGDYDVVKDVLARRGAITLWSVRMRPAKPLAFGTLDGPNGRKVPHLGLPGNPVSAMVAFEQFGRAALHVMLGIPLSPKPTVEAVMDDPVHNHDGRRVYARVVVYKTDKRRLQGTHHRKPELRRAHVDGRGKRFGHLPRRRSSHPRRPEGHGRDDRLAQYSILNRNS